METNCGNDNFGRRIICNRCGVTNASRAQNIKLAKVKKQPRPLKIEKNIAKDLFKKETQQNVKLRDMLEKEITTGIACCGPAIA